LRGRARVGGIETGGYRSEDRDRLIYRGEILWP